MAIESASDRAVFVNPDEFGATASWSVGGAPGIDVKGLFDEPSGRTFEGPGLATVRPSFTMRSADLPADASAGEHTPDRLTITVDDLARIFAPRVIERDGSGFAIVSLEDLT